MNAHDHKGRPGDSNRQANTNSEGKMITRSWKLKEPFGRVLAFCLCAAVQLEAQRAPTAPAAGTTRNVAATSGATTRQYPPTGAVGEALLSSDPETRRLIVITDDETSQYVNQVVTNLDRPKPQVLIKVVFLEVTYGKSYDLGLEGGTARRLNNSTTLGISNVFGLASQGT